MAMFAGAMLIVGMVLVPETYSPVILQKRALRLTRATGKVYKSRIELSQGTKSIKTEIPKALLRPWALLFREPIVFLLSIYMAIIYGTL